MQHLSYDFCSECLYAQVFSFSRLHIASLIAVSAIYFYTLVLSSLSTLISLIYAF